MSKWTVLNFKTAGAIALLIGGAYAYHSRPFEEEAAEEVAQVTAAPVQSENSHEKNSRPRSNARFTQMDESQMLATSESAGEMAATAPTGETGAPAPSGASAEGQPTAAVSQDSPPQGDQMADPANFISSPNGNGNPEALYAEGFPRAEAPAEDSEKKEAPVAAGGAFGFQGFAPGFMGASAEEDEAVVPATVARAPARNSTSTVTGGNASTSSGTQRYALSSAARAGSSSSSVSCFDLREGSSIQVLREVNGWAEIIRPASVSMSTDRECAQARTYWIPVYNLVSLPPVITTYKESSTVYSPFPQGVPVHKLPSAFSNYCGYLKHKAELRIVQQYGDWTEVQLVSTAEDALSDCRDASRLFVQSDFIERTRPTDIAKHYRHYVGTQVRTEARRSASSCGALPKPGEVIRVVDEQEDWTEIELPTDVDLKLKNCMRSNRLYVETRFLVELPRVAEDVTASKAKINSKLEDPLATEAAFVVQLPSQYGGDCGDIADGIEVEVLQTVGEWSEIVLPMDLVLSKCVDPERLFVLSKNLETVEETSTTVASN